MAAPGSKSMTDPFPFDADVAIETPEHIVFRHRMAGAARRALAYLLDLLICYGAVVVIAIIVMLAVAGAAGVSGAVDETVGLGVGFLLVVIFAAQWVYFATWEALKGTTPGKMAAGLRVVTTTGRPIGWSAAILRNLLRAADALPIGYVAGLAAMTISPRFQRFGDLVAGTMVIIVPRSQHGVSVRIWPPPQPAREHELASMIIEPMSRRFGFRLPDPARTLALLYERAMNAGRTEGPPSSRGSHERGTEPHQSWR
jgi:uncharacterized RDD family membrane protein YckC